ncbi:Plug domain-containing protein [Brevundimonas denitrificans]|uniref:Plug domain-containing protein n=1 Tax=Brevundimonas denitrificans TaxID=1443434 RepID=UPI00352C3F09
MRSTLLAATSAFAFALALTAVSPALAQEAEAAPAPQAGNGRQVLTFTPDFFADQNPNTALDMVNRVPGFSLDDGDGSRGFEGAVGNVLINGSRPASKNDLGSSVLSRTLATQVVRIELIRGARRASTCRAIRWW